MCFWEQDLLHSIFCSRWRAPEMHKKALRNVFASAYSASAVTVHQVGRRVTVPVAEVLRPRMAALQSTAARDRLARRKPAAKSAARHGTITVARPRRSDAWAMYPYPEKILFRW